MHFTQISLESISLRQPMCSNSVPEFYRTIEFAHHDKASRSGHIDDDSVPMLGGKACRLRLQGTNDVIMIPPYAVGQELDNLNRNNFTNPQRRKQACQINYVVKGSIYPLRHPRPYTICSFLLSTHEPPRTHMYADAAGTSVTSTRP